ncbi:MAG: hypothetical protein HY237_14350 [Acidobacteria bacterium]|nr:hypothetical protein [Acidobacteriota bacterium]
MLGEERRQRILERVGGLLAGIDHEVHLLDVLLDSTREQLAFVMQKGEWPLVLGMNYLDYVSHRDEELCRLLEAGLNKRLEAARERQAREQD